MTQTRSTSIMSCDFGDVTIVWDESEDDKMEAIIRKKMDEGVTFFIVEPRMFGLLLPKKTALKKAREARKHRALALKDPDFATFIEGGSGDVVKSPGGTVNTVKVATSAKEAAKSQTVGVKPMKGG